MSETVRLSAQKIAWPPRCVCCLCLTVSTSSIAATRRKGVRVIRTQTKSWDVPYCRRCLDHHDAVEVLRASRRQRKAHVSSARTNVAVAYGAPFAIAAAFCFFGFAGNEIFLALCLFVAVALASLAFVFGPLATKALARITAEEDELCADARDELDELLTDECACADPAADYHGWQGHVHTFAFRSHRYASLFRQANAAKLV